MYSREERLKAIELFIKYDRSAATVIHELGYPSFNLLPRWYAQYLEEQESGVIWERYRHTPKYSEPQQEAAIRHFLDHGRSLARTVRALGYPCRETLRAWCRDGLKAREKRVISVQYTKEQKLECVLDLCTRNSSAQEVAKTHEVSRGALYKWKQELLAREDHKSVPKPKAPSLPDDRNALIAELATLKKQVYRLQMEKDILEATAEILKKDPGVDREKLTNQEKTLLVGTLKNKYPLAELLEFVGLARSNYFYHRKIATLPDKYETLRGLIIRLFAENNQCYGYRRIHGELRKDGVRVSEKVIQTLMAQQQLVVRSKKKRKYSSYQGEITPAVPNLVARDFHAEAPNVKWLTDLTEFHIPAGKVYLSPIVDCFDGLVASWSIGTSPDAELVNGMLDAAISTLNPGEQPIVDSDRERTTGGQDG